MTSRLLARGASVGLRQQRAVSVQSIAVRYASGGGGFNEPTGEIKHR